MQHIEHDARHALTQKLYEIKADLTKPDKFVEAVNKLRMLLDAQLSTVTSGAFYHALEIAGNRVTQYTKYKGFSVSTGRLLFDAIRDKFHLFTPGFRRNLKEFYRKISEIPPTMDVTPGLTFPSRRDVVERYPRAPIEATFAMLFGSAAPRQSTTIRIPNAAVLPSLSMPAAVHSSPLVNPTEVAKQEESAFSPVGSPILENIQPMHGKRSFSFKALISAPLLAKLQSTQGEAVHGFDRKHVLCLSADMLYTSDIPIVYSISVNRKVVQPGRVGQLRGPKMIFIPADVLSIIIGANMAQVLRGGSNLFEMTDISPNPRCLCNKRFKLCFGLLADDVVARAAIVTGKGATMSWNAARAKQAPSVDEDDDIIHGDKRISFKDPLSQRTMMTPARSTACTHSQCFDLDAFLDCGKQSLARFGVYPKCPICGVVVPFEKLFIDPYVSDILSRVLNGETSGGSEKPSLVGGRVIAHGVDVDEVVIESDGRWHVPVPTEKETVEREKKRAKVESDQVIDLTGED